METRAYGDFSVSQVYSERDEMIILGENSPNDLTKHFLKPDPRVHGTDAKQSYAIVTTNSGNKYIFGDGQIANVNNGRVYPFPKGDLVVTVGRSLHMSGITVTSTVKSVEVEMLEPLAVNNAGGAIPVAWANAESRDSENPSPFEAVREVFTQASPIAQATQQVSAPTPRQGVRF